MGLVLGILFILFVGGIVLAMVSLIGLIYIIKRNAQTRYIAFKLMCISILFLIAVVVMVGCGMMMYSIFKYPIY